MTSPRHPTVSMRARLRAYHAALHQLDHEEARRGPVVDSRRATTRVRFDAKLIVVNSADASQIAHDRFVAPRNIGVGGVGFLYLQFMHAGMECKVSLPTQAGGWLRVPARVVRCRHVSGTVHECAARFNELVDVSALEGIADEDRDVCYREYQKAVADLITSRDRRQRIVIATMSQDRADHWRAVLGTDLADLEIVQSLDGARQAALNASTSACVVDRLPTVQGMARIIASLRKVNEQVPLIALIEQEEFDQTQLLLAHGASACLPVSTSREDLILMVLQQCDIALQRPRAR